MPACSFDADGFFRCARREAFSDTPQSGGDAPALDIRLSKGGVPVNGAVSRVQLPYSSTRRNSFVTALIKDTRWQTVKIDAKCPACPACPAAETCPQQNLPDAPSVYWTDVPSAGDTKVFGGFKSGMTNPEKNNDRYVCMIMDDRDRNNLSVGLTDPEVDHKLCVVSVRDGNKNEMTVANQNFMYLVQSSVKKPIGKRSLVSPQLARTFTDS
jgi:hypothetical protein